jgi:prevent-host-death family protein
MTMVTKTVPAGQFKAQCLALLDGVAQHRQALVITKRGKPVARVVPVGDDDALASLAGSVLEETELLSPIDETWEADR